MTDPIIIAVPKGRILDEALPLLAAVGIVPEPAFSDDASRALRFATNDAGIELIRVRAFDVATFVAHGAAQRSEEHTSELQSLMRISYAVFCLKQKKLYN